MHIKMVALVSNAICSAIRKNVWMKGNQIKISRIFAQLLLSFFLSFSALIFMAQILGNYATMRVNLQVVYIVPCTTRDV